MNLSEVYEYCGSKAGVAEGFPFGEDVLVFKVGGKMFAMTAIDQHPSELNLKCDPERAVELRETYDSIRPGYHMNKKHWNTLVLDGSLSVHLVRELIDHSYDLVFGSLTAKLKQSLGSG
jgi:predicted DNA-binding protein (MmcQ/YjbR family)